ncbi:MAG: hypothetical protein KDJ87_07450 [Rhizobiaceae bacterium]|nr:hypothetical protein [Rhizobiaceae bacterium]
MSELIAQPSPGNGPVVLRIVLAVLCLVPAAIGLGVIVAIFGSFLSGGFRFTGSDEVWMQLGLAAAAILVLPPAVVLGVVLRYARWKRAPQASLVLAVVTGGAGALVSGMLQTTVIPGDAESYILLMTVSVAGIVAGALPPFLHWWRARDTA